MSKKLTPAQLAELPNSELTKVLDIKPTFADHDITQGERKIPQKDIPTPTPECVLIQPNLGFVRNAVGDAVSAGGLIIPELSVNSELYNCCSGTIIALGSMAFRHKEMAELRGQFWLGEWPKVGDRVVFRDGGVGQRYVWNGVDVFSVLDEDIRAIVNDNIEIQTHFSHRGK